jgi:NitT/TauT family transport system substrate-binding protein
MLAIRLLVGLSIVIFVMGVPAGRVRAQSAGSSTDQVLRIHEYPGAIPTLQEWVAIDRGFCAAQKLQCELVTLPSGPLGLQALAAGSLDVSFASTDIAMLAREHGNDVRLIVGHSPNNIMTLSIRSDIPTPHLGAGYPAVMKDFKDLRVGVTGRGAATELQTVALLTGAGINPDSVSFVAVGAPTTAYAALLAKQIDASLMFEPFATLCTAQKTCVTALDLVNGAGPPDVTALNGAYETYWARADFIAKHPAAIQGFIHAISDSIAWIQDPANFDDVVATAKRHMSLGEGPGSDALLVQLVRKQIPTYGPKINRQSVAAWSNFLVTYKLLDKPAETKTFVYEYAP